MNTLAHQQVTTYIGTVLVSAHVIQRYYGLGQKAVKSFAIGLALPMNICIGMVHAFLVLAALLLWKEWKIQRCFAIFLVPVVSIYIGMARV